MAFVATRARFVAGLCGTAAIATAGLAACDTEQTPPPEAASVTFHRDVRPLIERSCTSCHFAGGPTPYDFTVASDAASAPPWSQAAVDAVLSGAMPPWMASDDCRDVRYARRLSDEEHAVFRAWADEGFAMGSPADFAALAPLESPTSAAPPDLVLRPAEAYTPSTEAAGDYRCFLLPEEFTADTFVVGSHVVPDRLEVAHHALIYLIQPSVVGAVQALDAEDATPGYSCFGGPGGGALVPVGGWAPGGVPVVRDEGSAIVVPAGSRLVLQMHYNTLALAGAQPQPDRTTVELWTTSTQPAARVEILPLAHLTMEIPPFEAAYVAERLFEVPADGVITGVGPHMHLLGTSIRVEHERAGQAACMVDVPAWDFHWQQQYSFAAESAVPVQKGDKIRVRCTYDNTEQNQPLVGGVPKMPATAYWGEGTLDEMCLAMVELEVPFDAPDVRCGAYPSCQSTCAEGDGRCFFDCTTLGGGQCAACLLPAFFQCTPSSCGAPGIALQSCVGACEKDQSACLVHDCAAEWDAYYACMEPLLEGGDCNAQLAACNVAL